MDRLKVIPLECPHCDTWSSFDEIDGDLPPIKRSTSRVSFLVQTPRRTHHEAEAIQRSTDHRVLKEAEVGVKKQELCRKHGITEQTFYRWRSKYGGLQVADVTRLKQLEAENRQLKQLLAEAHLEQAALKELLSKNW